MSLRTAKSPFSDAIFSTNFGFKISQKIQFNTD